MRYINLRLTLTFGMLSVGPRAGGRNDGVVGLSWGCEGKGKKILWGVQVLLFLEIDQNSLYKT